MTKKYEAENSGTHPFIKDSCLAFIRHGEPTQNDDDQERPLSKNGRTQTQKRACSLTSIPFDLIVSSSAKRSLETAKIIKANNSPNVPIEIVSELYLPLENADKQTIIHMLNSLGPLPLKHFLENDKSGSWKHYCEESMKALTKTIAAHAAHTILIVAHANIINDLGIKFVPSAKEELLSAYFNYCDGFLITRQRKVELL